MHSFAVSRTLTCARIAFVAIGLWVRDVSSASFNASGNAFASGHAFCAAGEVHAQTFVAYAAQASWPRWTSTAGSGGRSFGGGGGADLLHADDAQHEQPLHVASTRASTHEMLSTPPSSFAAEINRSTARSRSRSLIRMCWI